MIGRPGSDSDVGACILFLAEPGGLYLNSQVLYPDGGGFVAPVETASTDGVAGDILTQPAAA